ncbi:N-acetylmuramoyl-L-alanine amidase [Clostridium sp. NSJ-6]|uniref:N-acetylmuramoyl-L-alanine amidase n=1 Tax=Clostridium hominis TaxID=2763036 RepID=A0ABR7DGU9_9CLOT|nr:N-acetylmuramoyl-L-alanine amidase [Clostridium hominis]MBC5630624.1 N-acetylmuramoyl-L-alanine amidase [Clostridium hominis]
MSLVKSLISSDKYGVKCPYKMTPKGICIHNTANDAPAKNEVSYMKSNNNEVSYHIAIDDLEAIQVIPFDRNAWHAGDGGSGQGNRNYIAVEICYSESGGDRFIKAEKRAAKEVAALLKQYGWTINNVKKHQDFSNKYCPHRTLDMGWQRFLNMIQTELNVLNGSYTQTPSSNQYQNIKVGSKVRVVGFNYATGESIPSWVKSNTYTVQQVNGDKCLLKEIVSWVYIRDLQIVSSGNTAPSTPTQPQSKRYAENGTFYFDTAVTVRTAPEENAKTNVVYYPGEHVIYHHVIVNKNGFNWIEYARNNGTTGYLKVKDLSTGESYGYAK